MGKISIKIIGQGPPFILLHGWGWNSAIWLPLIPELEKKFQLFLVDIPCFDSYETISKQLFPYLPSKATWLGWSLGGMYAWWVAAHYSERVTRVITVASSPKFINENHWPGVPVNTLEKFGQLLVENQQKTLLDFLELQLRGSEQQENIFRELEPQIKKIPPSDLPSLLKGLSLLKETDLREDLKKITCPSLHIFGENDTLIPVKIVPFLTQQLPLGRCKIIKRAGHIPFLTHPEIFLESVLSFPI